MGKVNPRRDFLGTKTPGEFLMRGAPDRDDQKYWHHGDNFDRFKSDAYQADMNKHLASAAGGFSMVDEDGGENAKNWGKKGKEYTHNYVTELNNKGYSTQSIFEAFKQTGGSAFNSLDDYENTLDLLKGKYSRNETKPKKDKPKNNKPKKEEAPIRLSEELKGAQDRVRHHDEGIRSGQSTEDLYDFGYRPTENAKAFAGKYARDVGKAGGFKADNENFKRALEAVRQ